MLLLCLIDIHCQAVIEDDHLLPLTGSSHHEGPVLRRSRIQVQLCLQSEAKCSHTHAAAEGTRKEFTEDESQFGFCIVGHFKLVQPAKMYSVCLAQG